MFFFAKTMIATAKLIQMHLRLAFRLYRDHLSCFVLFELTCAGIPKRLGLSQRGKFKEELYCLTTMIGFQCCGTPFASKATRSRTG